MSDDRSDETRPDAEQPVATVRGTWLPLRRAVAAVALASCMVVALSCVPRASAAPPVAPITLTGSGAQVETVSLLASPAVVSFSHDGESNFIVKLQGQGLDDLVANEIGVYSGQTAVAGVLGGSYQLAVEADGNWKVTIAQPKTGVKPLLGSFNGSGSAVVKVRLPAPAQPVLTATNTGDSNFIVHLIRLARSQRETLLVNDLGPWSGELLVDERLPKGSYLLEVYAVGSWSLRFTR